MPDQLSALYSDLLKGSYDCVDRVVLNAYFSMGQSGGGFRVWWRALHGSDENLDDNHLMRMAGRFSRRLRAWAKANGIPVIYCSPGEDKHNMAEEHLTTRETKPGLFLILVSKAPALVWEVQMTGTGKLGQIVPKDPSPYVNHYSFHISDQDWGHLTIKMSGHPPFGAQVILNGHEYVACQAQKTGMEFTKQDNCFTSCCQPRGSGESRRYLVSERDCRATAPVMRPLDLYHLSVFCPRPGGARAEHVSVPVFRLSDGVQPEPAISLRPSDAADIPGVD